MPALPRPPLYPGHGRPPPRWAPSRSAWLARHRAGAPGWVPRMRSSAPAAPHAHGCVNICRSGCACVLRHSSALSRCLAGPWKHGCCWAVAEAARGGELHGSKGLPQDLATSMSSSEEWVTVRLPCRVREAMSTVAGRVCPARCLM